MRILVGFAMIITGVAGALLVLAIPGDQFTVGLLFGLLLGMGIALIILEIAKWMVSDG